MKEKIVYCHFSFRRESEESGLFSVAFFASNEDRKAIYYVTKRFKLWKNHQFITAIQAYEFALRTISELQGAMKKANIVQVVLVTDNSTLAGWIENPKKSKKYYQYMQKAVEQYCSGAPREIVLSVGLNNVLKYEKSYKYCKERYVVESEKDVPKVKKVENKSVIDVSSMKTKTANDVLRETSEEPLITNIVEI